MNLRDELQTIYDEHGKLTAALVVDAATPKDHPLHDRVFDRSRKEAADAWYLHRADELIRSVRVIRRRPDGERLSLRGFSPVRPEQPGVYDPLEVIASDPRLMTILLARMEREWRDMQRSYGHLAEFWEMIRKEAA